MKTKHTWYSINEALTLLILLALLVIPATVLFSEESFSAPVTANGEVLVFGGVVKDKLGKPVPDVSVEIWQTDKKGIYLHPGDSDTNRRDKGFQFFGTSVSDLSGNYKFRTIIPGRYEPRPRHIHVKIRRSGRVLLITQIYFAVDGETSGVGGSNRRLRMELVTIKHPDSSISYKGKFDFIVDTAVSGDLRLTDRQSEGPYYPKEDVSLYDNDLAHIDDM